MRLFEVTISPALSVTRFVSRMVVFVGRSLLSPTPDGRVLGTCGSCQQPVYGNDAFLRYGGGYYHGDICVERDPPAERRRAEPAGQVP